MIWENVILNSVYVELSIVVLNLFSTNVPLLYPLKKSENWRFSDVVRDYRSGTLGEDGFMRIMFVKPTSGQMFPFHSP